MDLQLTYPCAGAPPLTNSLYHSSMGGWTGGMGQPLTIETDAGTPCADLSIACSDLAVGNELSTAILLSLFSDRRANDDDVIPDGTDPRGWWADALDGQRIGSRLWLLERARKLPEVLRLAQEYAAEALAWLVADGVVKSAAVQASFADDCKTLLFAVHVCKPDGKSLAWRYRYAWDLRAVQSCESI